MMKQYDEAKSLCGDALLLFRMGDFYELFHDDAKTSAQALGLTLTSRDKGENPIPMAGFPHHQLDGYLAKLIKQGFRVAICEQVEDPKHATGLVKREVTRVVTPGTLTDDSLLDPRTSNYLAAVHAAAPRKNQPALAGLAWVELSTGAFFVASMVPQRLDDQLARIAPAECLVNAEDRVLQEQLGSRYVLTKRAEWVFSRDEALRRVNEQLGTLTLEGFGLGEEDIPGIVAAGAILDYLHETQRTSLEHIDRIRAYRDGTTLEIDQATRRSLELTQTMRDGTRQGSLWGVIDRTVTPMGSRLLADWLANPLTERTTIDERLDAVDELLGDSGLVSSLRGELREVYDLQRLLARIATGRASPRDIQFVCRTLQRLPKLKALLTARQSSLLGRLESEISLFPELRGQLESALVDQCPIALHDGGIIRHGYNQTLDELRALATGGKEWLSRYQSEQQAAAGIPLKIGFNKVFGFYIEITNTHRDKVPEWFIRKQTLKNAERYITPELKAYEDKVLSAEEKSKELEYDLFVQIREQVRLVSAPLRATADTLAQLDVLAGFAELANRQNYCRPQMVDEPILEIHDGRHPVLDILEPQGTFVPNDTRAGSQDGQLLLITGPNMAGKSTYIRQVALINIMAQMGCFVPATQARIGITDRVFARVGASDELARGQSTFMVEMTETARILHTATARSLVILDEIGRGTSTYDGVSLAWAIVEYLHDLIGCRTLFATHYHELTDLADTHRGVVNLNVAVREWDDKVVFLHKIVPGAANKSYGIHVAQLAGVPRMVNERAKEILHQLEQHHLDGRPTIKADDDSATDRPMQLTLFEINDHPLLDKVRDFPLDHCSPVEALKQIESWKRELDQESTTSKPR